MGYTVEKQYDGLYHVLDEEGDRVARVGRWMPGPMVSYTGPDILAPAHARAVGEAMTALAGDIEKEE
jgi:hypothetical protein